MTTWLCGVEQRWTMAAPVVLRDDLPPQHWKTSCRPTPSSARRGPLRWAWTTRFPGRAGAQAGHHSRQGTGLLSTCAAEPRRPTSGSRRSVCALGAEDNLALFVGPTEHGYTQENREAMYGWFNRVTGVSDAREEPALTIEKDETLWCTPHGQVAELASKPLYVFTREKSESLAKQRRTLGGPTLARAVETVLRLPARSGVPDYRILRPNRNRRYPLPNATTYAVETEAGIFAIVYRLSKQQHLSRPPRTADPAILYVSDLSADAELRDEPLIPELLDGQPAATVYTCDVRGTGESQPNTCDENSFS